MNRQLKIGFILGLFLLCLYVLWPSFQRYSMSREQFEALRTSDPARYQSLTENALHLGLDLQGGMHLLLGVRTEEVLDRELDGLIHDVKDWLGEDQIPFLAVRKTGKSLELSFQRPEDLERGREKLEGALGSSFSFTSRSADALQILAVQAVPAYVSKIQEAAFAQVMETLRNRVDQLGVAEPSIQRHGLSGHRILIQLPGLKDPDQAKRVIGKVAELQFRIVLDSAEDKASLMSRIPGGCSDADPGDQKEEYLCADGSVILPGELPGFRDATQRGYYHLEGEAPASGRDLESAAVGSGQYGKPTVHFTIKPGASGSFGRLTRENLGKQMAIVLDGQVKSAPTLEGRITRSGEITGSFTAQEAYELALTLRSGALPASVEYLEEGSVSASLGDDSIRQGTTAYVVGSLAVVLFMLFYYRSSGVNAVLGLGFTMLLILSALALSGATLTLPGIAGLVLTLGMGVDANVVIFERMRDELKLGKTVRAVVAAGFEKAFSAIADSNISTLIAAFVLLQFGSGPVRGFGVTLAIGVGASLFSALVVSRVLFDLTLRHVRHFGLRFRVFVENTAIDFFRWRKAAIAASSAILLLGALAMGYHRVTEGTAMNWGIEFSGGSLLQVRFEKPVDLAELRSTLERAGYRPSLQQFGQDNEVLIRTPAEDQAIEQTRSELQTRIHEGVKLRYLLEPQAAHTELVLVPEGGTKAVDLEAAVQALGLGKNASVRLDEGKVRVSVVEVTSRILGDLKAHYEPDNPVTKRHSAQVGPQIGAEMKGAALLATLVAVLCTLVYLSVRFEFPYALGAVVASFHDALMILAFFAVFRMEVDLTIVAALLTIVGYSLNDTIVIFDRVRENQKRFGREGFVKLINESLNETLSRTILTSLTTFMTTLSLLVLGGDVIRGFAAAMLVGIVAGSYSTIYIAAPVVHYWGICQDSRRR